MLFTLIKNELIKISKRAKTWIVFVLFLLSIVGVCVLSYMEEQNMVRYNSPEGRIESLVDQKKWENESIERAKENNDKWSEEEILRAEESIKTIDEEIKRQEERKNNPNDPDLWKKELEAEKVMLQESLDDPDRPDRYKTYEKERMADVNMLLENGIKPIEKWEFNAINNAKNFMSIMGMIILVAGIAVFMSDIVSGESTPPTLKFLLVQPISRGKVILSKFIAVVLTVVSMIGGLQLATFGVLGAINGFDAAKMPTTLGVEYKWNYSEAEMYGGPQLERIEGSGILSTRGVEVFQSFSLQILFIIACCAFVFLISSLFKSSMITMALSVILSVAATMSCMMSQTLSSKIGHLIFLNYGATPSVVTGDIAFMFNNPNFSVGLGVTLMVGTIIVSYVIAHVVFSKKDILI